MAETAHTPGPWFVVGPHPGGEWSIQDREYGAGKTIAQQYGDSGLDNALLIAAAPTMLEAIDQTIAALEAEFGKHRAYVNFRQLYDAQSLATGAPNA